MKETADTDADRRESASGLDMEDEAALGFEHTLQALGRREGDGYPVLRQLSGLPGHGIGDLVAGDSRVTGNPLKVHAVASS
ncbi:hypothetical protein FJT64_023450 [Amphibalanus amphitrite]|uniref:Uncharacterized protein n=1 Tax=Amphibalanus amphitrite TaxID=1232801 RepID=A0A6A4WMC3_AMPAM|nr:hypothetical protein FJT64_023450 [Amphibalanus amphitrite]